MPKRIENLVLDIRKKDNFTKFEVKQFDDITLNVSLLENGIEYNVGSSTAKLYVGCLGEVYRQEEGITVSENNVIINVDRNILSKKCIAYAEIELTDNIGTVTSSTFIFSIVDKVGEGANIPSSIEGFVARYEKMLAQFKLDSAKVVDDLEKDYDSLKGIILDENASANLQNQINQVNSQLEHIEHQYNISNGIIKMPLDFPSIPFDVIYQNGVFEANIKPKDILDTVNSNIVYIDTLNNSSSTSGFDINTPISLGRFSENLSNNVYTKSNIVVNFLNNFESFDTGITITSQGKNIYFRSMSPRGITWVGRLQRPNTPGRNECSGSWESYNNIFKIVQDKYYEVMDIVNPTKEFDEMICYVKVTDLSTCLNTKGTYYQDNTTVYLNPKANENIKNCFLALSQGIFNINGTTSNKLVFENICFPIYSYRQYPTTTSFETYFFNCLWHRNPNDALAFQGVYKTYLINCVASYGNKDGFNYHTTSTESLAVEVNCKAYGSGVNKVPSGNTTTHSNNGSTAHDGMKVARFGCTYYNCQGPIVADVNDCYSINVGVRAYNCAAGNTGIKASFYFDDANGKSLVVDCDGGGLNVDYSVRGTSSTKISGMRGLNKFYGDVQLVKECALYV